MTPNPRNSNGSLRRRHKERLRGEGRPCQICLMPIDYTLPPGHPRCFEVDEIVPISRYWEGGYASPREAAQDYANLGAAHRECNQRRGNKPLALARAEAAKRIARASRNHGETPPRGRVRAAKRDY